MNIKDLLIKHEGLKLFVYKDTMGIDTIGVGRNLVNRGITREEALLMLDNDIKDFTEQLIKALPWVATAPEQVKIVLLDMGFNLGIQGLLQFSNTLNHIKLKQYKEAADDMMKSLWAKQVGVRAVEDCNILRSL